MTYDLAKELKEKGFVYKNQLHRAFKEDGTFRTIGDSKEDNYILEPTLEELIEACGKKIALNDKRDCGWSKEFLEHDNAGTPLVDLDKEWHASKAVKDSMLVGQSRYVHAFGDTPSEAVAKLWLALNQK